MPRAGGGGVRVRELHGDSSQYVSDTSLDVFVYQNIFQKKKFASPTFFNSDILLVVLSHTDFGY